MSVRKLDHARYGKQELLNAYETLQEVTSLQDSPEHWEMARQSGDLFQVMAAVKRAIGHFEKIQE